MSRQWQQLSLILYSHAALLCEVQRNFWALSFISKSRNPWGTGLLYWTVFGRIRSSQGWCPEEGGYLHCGVRRRSLSLPGLLQTLPQMLYPMTLPALHPLPARKTLHFKGAESHYCLRSGFLHSWKGSSTERDIGRNTSNISLLSQPRTKAKTVKSSSSLRNNCSSFLPSSNTSLSPRQGRGPSTYWTRSHSE